MTRKELAKVFVKNLTMYLNGNWHRFINTTMMDTESSSKLIQKLQDDELTNPFVDPLSVLLHKKWYSRHINYLRTPYRLRAMRDTISKNHNWYRNAKYKIIYYNYLEPKLLKEEIKKNIYSIWWFILPCDLLLYYYLNWVYNNVCEIILDDLIKELYAKKLISRNDIQWV